MDVPKYSQVCNKGADRGLWLITQASRTTPAMHEVDEHEKLHFLLSKHYNTKLDRYFERFEIPSSKPCKPLKG